MTDGDCIRSILLMLLLVMCSAYFSATETAFSSYNRIRIKSLAEDGSARAILVLRLSKNYDRLLSAVLVGNNIVNIALTTVATLFFVQLYGSSRGATVSTVVSTVVVLIFGEISPKTLAKDHAEGFVLATAPLIRVIVGILTPVNALFSLWRRLLNRIFHAPAETAVTEEELLTIVDEAEQGGSLNEQESELIRSAIEFNDREAVDILIPRVDMVGVEADASPAELGAMFGGTGFSRLPVYEQSMDNIIGVVNYKEYYKAQDATPRQLMKPAVFIPPTVKIHRVLRQLQQEKAHIAIVADEYGGTLGLVTMEDILEELVGEIWDEHDDVVENIHPQPDGSCRVLCSTELKDLMERFDTDTDCDATTVSGWVMEQLGRIPVAGDSFTADGLQVTVTAANYNHPEEISVRPVSGGSSEE